MSSYVLASEGWMSDQEMEFLRESVRSARSASTLAVEVGSWKGRSASALAQEAITFCVDHFKGGPQTGKERFVLPAFVANMDTAGCLDRVVILPKSSEEGLRFLGRLGVRFRVGLLDADHSEEAVAKDLPLLWDLIDVGGYLLVDDYVGGWPGVKVALDKFLAEKGLGVEKVVDKIARVRKA